MNQDPPPDRSPDRPTALRATRWFSRKSSQAFTLVELLIGMTIATILGAVAFSSYNQYIYKAQVATSVTDMIDIATRVKEFELNNRRLPNNLAEIGRAGQMDPWGSAYQYLNLETLQGNGQARKRKSLAPLNSDFDLYSIGLDKSTSASLMNPAARDDVVRALDGRFMGLATTLDN